MTKFSEKLRAYQEAIKPVNRSNAKPFTVLPDKSKVFMCGGPMKHVGVACVYKVELGNTKDFGIIATKTPFSRSISLGYCSRTIKAYGGVAFLKHLESFDNEKDARTYAEDLRKDLEDSCVSNFKRLY